MYLGRLEEARRAAKEATRLVEACGELEVLTWVHSAASVWIAYTAGGLGPVLETAYRGLEIAEKLDNEKSRMWGYVGVGMAHPIDAQFSEASEALRAAAGIARRAARIMLPQVLAILAEAHLALGERGEALAAAHKAIDGGRDGGCRYSEASAQIALAQILLVTDGDVPRAEIKAALDRAEELVAEVEGRSLSPRILELRGRCAAALGDTGAAERALSEALDIYGEIGATGHAERLSHEIAA